MMVRAQDRSGPTLRDRYQRIAPLYDLLDLPFEYGRYRALRPRLFAGLSGRILDAGVGTGRNMPFYPAGAAVVGVDLSAAMLERARRRQHLSRAHVQLGEMNLSRLAFADSSFDAAVATFVFCTLPDDVQLASLRELRRIVRPDGTIRLMDYVEPQGRLRRAITRLWEPWVAWAYGARYDRPAELRLSEAGLILTSSTFVVPDLVKLVEARPAK
jgi:ubiquinone/menaquinone biosynthesis C-methylase UbiE